MDSESVEIISELQGLIQQQLSRHSESIRSRRIVKNRKKYSYESNNKQDITHNLMPTNALPEIYGARSSDNIKITESCTTINGSNTTKDSFADDVRNRRQLRFHRQCSSTSIDDDQNYEPIIKKLSRLGSRYPAPVSSSSSIPTNTVPQGVLQKFQDDIHLPSINIITNQKFSEFPSPNMSTNDTKTPLKEWSNQSATPNKKGKSLSSASSPKKNGKKVQLDKGTIYTSRVQTPHILRDESNLVSTKLIDNTLKEIEEMSLVSSQMSRALTSVALLDGWTSAYEQELSSFESVALFAEIRMKELFEKESHHGVHPSTLKAAVCADLLKKIIRLLGRYSHILEPLMDELLNSIYVDYPKLKTKFQSTGDVNLQALYTAVTYFDQSEQQQEQLVETELELKMFNEGHNMRDVLQKFQTVKSAFDGSVKMIRDACFNLWKDYTKLRVTQRREQNMKIKKDVWMRWQQYRMLVTGKLPKQGAAAIGINTDLLDKVVSIIQFEKEKLAQASIPSQVSVNFDDKIAALFDETAAKRKKEDEEYELRQREKEKERERLRKLRDRSTQTDNDWLEIIRAEIQALYDKREEEEDENEEEKDKKDDEDKKRKAKKKEEKEIKMAVDGASQLIAQIYEYKAVAIRQDPSQLDFQDKTLLDYARDVLVLRFGVKKIAQSNLKAIIACCAGDTTENKRLTVFADISGIATKLAPDREFSPSRCSFFFRAMGRLFPQPLKNISTVLGHKTREIEKETVLQTVKYMFQNVCLNDIESYKQIEKAFIDLPYTSKAEVGAKIIYKVNVDEVLSLLMKFADTELSQPTSLHMYSVALIVSRFQRFIKKCRQTIRAQKSNNINRR